ncbi:hypothetical protein ACHAWF_006030 [Thalassiosira exigua]
MPPMAMVSSSPLGGRVKKSLGNMVASGLGLGGSEPSTPPRPARRQSSESNGTNGDSASPPAEGVPSQDEMFLRLRWEAAEVVKREPILSMLLSKVGLLDASSLPMSIKNGGIKLPCPLELEPASSFESVVARIVSHRLSTSCPENICPQFLRRLLEEAFANDSELEAGHTMSQAVREDAMAILTRDPACETLLEAVLFMKGFHSLVIHRAARRAWKPDSERVIGGVGEGQVNASTNGSVAGGDPEQVKSMDADDSSASVSGRRFVALLLQSQASSAFGVDIHPASTIGAGVMFDHASGIVIGETATVGDGTTILHGVTLGGTGKDHGDRHPKIGKDVLVGAGTKILGNITVGDRAKIGAGSVVLRPIPSGATAVGAPAKIIGYTPQGEKPGSAVDSNLEGVEPLVGKRVSTMSTAESSTDLSAATSGSSGSASDETEVAGPKTDEEKAIDEEQEKLTGNEQEDDEKKGTRDKVSFKDDDKEEQIDIATGEDEDKDDGGDEGEDDDNVTDFGTTPKCRYVNVSKHESCLCPFQGVFCDVSTTSRRDECISHTELRGLLIQEGCNEGECVEVFFELLHRTPSSSKARQCGCVPLEIFAHCFPEVAKEKTRLDDDTIQALARGDLHWYTRGVSLSIDFTLQVAMRSTFIIMQIASPLSWAMGSPITFLESPKIAR